MPAANSVWWVLCAHFIATQGMLRSTQTIRSPTSCGTAHTYVGLPNCCARFRTALEVTQRFSKKYWYLSCCHLSTVVQTEDTQKTSKHSCCIQRRIHPGLPGVLRHSIKLRTLPQDTWLIESVENKSYSDLAGMMTSPTQCTIYDNRSEVCCLGHWQQSHRKPTDVFGGDVEKFELTETAGYSAWDGFSIMGKGRRGARKLHGKFQWCFQYSKMV
jgi:hypothetical protein